MKIIVVVKREDIQDRSDIALHTALNEAFCAKTDKSNTLIVVSIGSNGSTQQLEMAIESGADKGIQIITHDSLSAYTIAEYMIHIVICEKPDLIIISDQLTSEQCQTSKTLSSMLSEKFPVKRCALDRNQYRLLVIREILSGAHTVLLPTSESTNITEITSPISARYREYIPFKPMTYSA